MTQTNTAPLTTLRSAESTLAAAVRGTAAAVRSMGNPVADALADLQDAVAERQDALRCDMAAFAQILGSLGAEIAREAELIAVALPAAEPELPLLGVAAPNREGHSDRCNEIQPLLSDADTGRGRCHCDCPMSEHVATAACSPVDCQHTNNVDVIDSDPEEMTDRCGCRDCGAVFFRPMSMHDVDEGPAEMAKVDADPVIDLATPTLPANGMLGAIGAAIGMQSGDTVRVREMTLEEVAAIVAAHGKVMESIHKQQATETVPDAVKPARKRGKKRGKS